MTMKFLPYDLRGLLLALDRKELTASQLQALGAHCPPWLQDEYRKTTAQRDGLRAILMGAEVVALPDSADVVATGTDVTVERVASGEEAIYTVAGSMVFNDPTGTRDPAACRISTRAPVGAALLGRKVGDMVAVELPEGRSDIVRIVAIKVAGF